jgi:hypothetical protein
LVDDPYGYLFDIIKSFDEGENITLNNIIDSWYLLKILVNNKNDEENYRKDNKNPTRKFWTQFRRWVESRVTHDSLTIQRYQIQPEDYDLLIFRDEFEKGEQKKWHQLGE